MQPSSVMWCDMHTWRNILAFLPRSALRRAAKVNRALRATIDSAAFRCDIVDRIFFVTPATATDFFASLQDMHPWAVRISFYITTTGGEEDVARTLENCHVVAIAVAINCVAKYFRSLAQLVLPPPLEPSTRELQQLGEVVIIRSGSSQAPAKAAISDRLLTYQTEELGDFLLTLSFAVVRTSLNALGAPDRSVYEREKALFDSTESPLEPMLEKALTFCGSASFSNETLQLLSSLPHLPRLLQLLERLVGLEGVARQTRLINYDEVHDLNENVQNLCGGAWLERTMKVLRSRGKGRKWLESRSAKEAATNPSALMAHMAWCRRLSMKLTAWISYLPAVVLFADNADHRLAPQFLQSLLTVCKTRLGEQGRQRCSSPVAFDDLPRCVSDPRSSHPERFTVFTALRLAELDSEFAAQLVTFSPL